MTAAAIRRLCSLAVACGALAGCSVFQFPDAADAPPEAQGEPERETASARPAAAAESLIEYFQRLRKLSGPDIAREHETARQSFVRSRSDYERIRLAMVLSVPGFAFSDDGRALELLDPVSRNHNGQLQGLAFLLASHLQERRRLDATAQGLQQKLDALKSLERSLIDRKR